jgi:hypothetical protein
MFVRIECSPTFMVNVLFREYNHAQGISENGGNEFSETFSN